MIINGVKVTLIICLTIIVSCVLFISYNEYTNRYSLIATNDNNLYIFDKKSTVLNKCTEDGCKAIETKFPISVPFINGQSFAPSKMFNSSNNKPMVDELAKIEAIPENPNPAKKTNKVKNDIEKKEDSVKEANNKEEKNQNEQETTEFIE